MVQWRRKRLEKVSVHAVSEVVSTIQRISRAYRKRHNLVGSMSARGRCYDNACAESFFHTR